MESQASNVKEQPHCQTTLKKNSVNELNVQFFHLLKYKAEQPLIKKIIRATSFLCNAVCFWNTACLCMR